MIKLKQAVIVEGKYDKIKLSNFIDALIIPTEGFGIFKNAEKREFIKMLAKKCGIIIITDSDSAGMVIRNHLKSIAAGGSITQVFLPQIKGKEKRKTVGSAEGFLGLEGLSEAAILEALNKSGIMGSDFTSQKKLLTKSDLFSLGLSGTADSKQNRLKVYLEMGLPSNLSTNSFLDYINHSSVLDDFERACKICLPETDKS